MRATAGARAGAGPGRRRAAAKHTPLACRVAQAGRFAESPGQFGKPPAALALWGFGTAPESAT